MTTKTDMSLVGGDGSREGGTGIGLAVADSAKSAEARFMDAAAQQLADLGADVGEEAPKRRKPPKQQPEETDVQELDDEEATEDEEEIEDEEQGSGEEDQQADDDSEEDTEESRVSIRLNGKKADLEDVLDHVGATVVVNGEEIEVTGSELIKGYQRGKDYSDKTTEVKQMRDELMPYNQMVSYAKQDPQFLEHVQSYFQNGPMPGGMNADPLLKTSDSQLSKMLDENDASYDPKTARKVMELRNEWTTKSAERQQVAQRANQDAAARWNAWADDQVRMAQQQINQIGTDLGNQYKGDETEYTAKTKQVLESLATSGYTEQEIMGQAPINAASAKFAILAYKASEFDRMVQESDAPRVTLGKKRKRIAPPRSQKTGHGTRKTPTQRQQRDSFRKASKEQTTDSWVDAISSRLNRR